jgi:hypothetical protein
VPRSDAADDSVSSDLQAIEQIVAAFFSAFTSGADVAQRMDRLRGLFVPEAVIVRTCGLDPAVYDVDGFIAPRQALLSNGSLSEFREWELSGRTELFGDIAHRFGSYAKSWVQDGTSVSGRGMKTIQFVRTTDGWRISAVAWDDEREGLKVPQD